MIQHTHTPHFPFSTIFFIHAIKKLKRNDKENSMNKKIVFFLFFMN
jgi:hypothetical protein